jgi:hypothetical protein
VAIDRTPQTAFRSHQESRLAYQDLEGLHPKAKVELRTMSTIEMVSLLRRGELDICMSVSALPDDHVDFTSEEIRSYRPSSRCPMSTRS